MNHLTSNKQYNDILNDDILTSDLDILANKYDNYQKNKKGPYIDLVESKNKIIDDLKNDIKKLKQELIDMSVNYNSKIEQLRIEHKRELNIQHHEYMKKIKETIR